MPPSPEPVGLSENAEQKCQAMTVRAAEGETDGLAAPPSGYQHRTFAQGGPQGTHRPRLPPPTAGPRRPPRPRQSSSPASYVAARAHRAGCFPVQNAHGGSAYETCKTDKQCTGPWELHGPPRIVPRYGSCVPIGRAQKYILLCPMGRRYQSTIVINDSFRIGFVRILWAPLHEKNEPRDAPPREYRRTS